MKTGKIEEMPEAHEPNGKKLKKAVARDWGVCFTFLFEMARYFAPTNEIG